MFLSIILNEQTTCALIDSAASDYFVREKFLTLNIVREDVKCVIYTASKNQKIHVRTACFLPVTIAGYTEKVRFLVSNELRNDVTLGRSWLKAQKAVQDHDHYRAIITLRQNSLRPKIFSIMFSTGSRLNTCRVFSIFYMILLMFSFALGL